MWSEFTEAAALIPMSVWAAFLLASWALNLTPGQDVLFIIANTLSGGRRAGMASGVGVSCGSLVHVALAVLGVAALIRASETAFMLLRWGGALYLVWLAIAFWRAPPMGEPGAGTSSASRAFWRGALNCILNPKVSVFILAFLPQFTDPARGSISGQILALGLFFCVASVPVHLAWALVAAGLGAPLRRFGRWMNRISAGIMALLALRLVVGRS